MNSNLFKELEKYGEETICYVLDGKNCSSNNQSLSIVKAKELCEMDGGRELLRTDKKSLPKSFKLHGSELKFNVIYSTPECKELAEIAKKKYKADLIMLF